MGPALSFVVVAKDEAFISYTTPGNTKPKKERVDAIDLTKDEIYYDTLGNVLHYNFNDFYRRYDVGLVFCTGMNIVTSSTVDLFIELRYVQGLLNFNRLSEKAKEELVKFNQIDPSNIIIIESEARHRVMSVLIGAEFFF